MIHTTTQDAIQEEVRAVCADRSRLLDVAERVRERFGYFGTDAVATIASSLGIHAIEFAYTASFYSFHDRRKRGHFRIRLSKTPISFMKGAHTVAEAFEQMLGLSVAPALMPDVQF